MKIKLQRKGAGFRNNYLALFILLSFSFTVNAQVYQNDPAYGRSIERYEVRKALHIPTFCGVPNLTGDVLLNKSAIAFDSCNNRLYYYNPKDSSWNIAGSGGVQGSILNDSTFLLCNSNGCDTFIVRTIAISNFTFISDSSVAVCNGSNVCDTIYFNPVPLNKFYVDSTKLIGDSLFYWTNGIRYAAGTISHADSLDVALLKGGKIDTSHIPPFPIVIDQKGTGLQLVYADGTDTLKVKNLQAGTGITLTQNADSSITINSTGSGSTDTLPLHNQIADIQAGKVNISDTAAMLSPYIRNIVLNTPNVIFSTPINYSTSGNTATGTLSLLSQSAYRVFSRASGSGTPSFNSLDTNYFNNNWATYVRAVNQPVITKSPIVTITHILPDLYDSIAIILADAAHDGYLSSVDWNRFNTQTDTSLRIITANNFGGAAGNGAYTYSKGLRLQNLVSATAGGVQDPPPITFAGSYWTGSASARRFYRISMFGGPVSKGLYFQTSTDSSNWTTQTIFDNSVVNNVNGFSSTVNFQGGAFQNGGFIIRADGSANFGATATPLPFVRLAVTDTTKGFVPPRGSTLARLKIGTTPYKFNITNPGSGYTGTTFSAQSITGGSGTQVGFPASGTISSGAITSLVFNLNSAYNYRFGDVIGVSAPGGTGFSATITKLQGDTACGMLFYDTTLNRQFSWNCANHNWEPLGQNPHVVFTPTTGSTVTAESFQEHIINPAGTIAALTIALPSTPYNNDKVWLKFTQAVTTITYSGGTVLGPPTTVTAGQQFYLTYDLTDNKWY